MRNRLLTLTTLLLLAACSSDDKPEDKNNEGGSSSTTGGKGGGQPPVTVVGGAMHTGPMFAGAECPTDVGFPAAYALPNLKGAVDGSNVRITFDPAGDARDYRVYALPRASDVSADAVKGAVYRCAGGGSVPSPAQDDEKREPVPGISTRVVGDLTGFKRTLEDATLGYVYTTPADDRLPVYALGDPDLKADNLECYEMRWQESRAKRYITSEAERDKLLAAHWRDDGIVFYVPKPGAAGIEPIYEAQSPPGDFKATHYLKTGAELDFRKANGETPIEAFSVYSATREGAEPLMRVFYNQTCGHGHDEVVAGLARFNKAYAQGASPVTELHFSGLTEETTLVVEALDALCPFGGIVSPMPRPARIDKFEGYDIDYPPYQTPEELAAASPTGEVFINGQGNGTKPHAISRACVKVKPEAAPQMDFFYDGSVETYAEGRPRNFQIWDTDSPTFDVQFHAVATDQWAIGSLFGELWVTYADWAADTNGKLRITPKARTSLTNDSFVHASMEVDIVSTQRRYPQLLIGNVEPPVQDNLEKGTTIVIQPFGGITTPVSVQIQFCDHRTWDVNNQCPGYELAVLKDGGEAFLSPRVEINSLMAVDRTVRFDAYVSTSRVYLFTNTVPYGCVDLPAGKLGVGPGTVTFGDVLYHSSVDLEKWYPFHVEHMHTTTSRHYSNLGFSSGQGAPPWDEKRLPCVPASSLK
jgi:hypothetical protein